MRIVTRPDFDGIVCAVLLKKALPTIENDIIWVEPNDMQNGAIEVKDTDILANLPYNKNCGLWFDHHFSNQIDVKFNGAFEIAPSAAGIIYRYYAKEIGNSFDELVFQTDKIDSANLTIDEILTPENYPFIILSMTITGGSREEEPYWNRLVDLLTNKPIDEILKDRDVNERIQKTIKKNTLYKDLLIKHTTVVKTVSITDFRHISPRPSGNRFMVYSLFPQSNVNLKISINNDNKNIAIINAGHSILNQTCNVNVGSMLSKFNGGGHKGAGSCSLDKSKIDETLEKLVEILIENKSLD